MYPPQLHDNADITKDQQETSLLLDSILLTQSRSTSSGSRSREQVLAEVADDILKQLPKAFDFEAVQTKYPVSYTESMNTVLCQEVIRFDRLYKTITSSLNSLKKALVGLVVMNASLEKVANSMFDGKVRNLLISGGYRRAFAFIIRIPHFFCVPLTFRCSRFLPFSRCPTCGQANHTHR